MSTPTNGPAYYNEFDPYAAQWLRNLIAGGHIAPGFVDERSIEDVSPADLLGYRQCHFFAGVGVWSLALRRAGWADDREIWTGSCPCQPFSAAGEGRGFDDERHLWPAFHYLIAQRRPAIVVGEQVASKDANPWIDLVCADVEALGYRFGAVPFPAASVGAPHIRDRLYWLAHASSERRREERDAVQPGQFGASGCGVAIGMADAERQRHDGRGSAGSTGSTGSTEGRRADAPRHSALTHGLGDAIGAGLAQRERHAGIPSGAAGTDEGQAAERAGVHACGLAVADVGRLQVAGLSAEQHGDGEPVPAGRGEAGEHDGAVAGGVRAPVGMANTDGVATAQIDASDDTLDEQRASFGWGAELAAGVGAGSGTRDGADCSGRGGVGASGDVAGMERPGPTNGYWRVADWLLCRDGKWRPVEPGTFPLAHGAPARVGRLRAYGNAINASQAQIFIEVVDELTRP